MGYFGRIKDALGASKAPIRHGHTYVDTITGERFEIKTVGRWVEIERFDAERRPENNVYKNTMREAIATGIVEHDPEKCIVCKNDTNVQ